MKHDEIKKKLESLKIVKGRLETPIINLNGAYLEPIKMKITIAE